MSKIKIGIVLSTIREQRIGDKIAVWVKEEAEKISEASYEVIDLRNYPMGFYGDKETANIVEDFNNKLAELDGYIFIVAEYNHSIPGVLKNALDCVSNNSMSNKAGAIISYGAVGGARAAEHLRNILSQHNVAHISRQVLFSIFDDFEKFSIFKPQALHQPAFKELIENTLIWSQALKAIR